MVQGLSKGWRNRDGTQNQQPARFRDALITFLSAHGISLFPEVWLSCPRIVQTRLAVKRQPFSALGLLIVVGPQQVLE
jgi:hypothetical protein